METRGQYIEKLAATLLDWDSKIDELRAKADLVSAETRLMYKKKIAELQELRERAISELGRLREAGEPGWREIRKTAETLAEEAGRLLKDLEKTFKKAA